MGRGSRGPCTPAGVPAWYIERYAETDMLTTEKVYGTPARVFETEK